MAVVRQLKLSTDGGEGRKFKRLKIATDKSKVASNMLHPLCSIVGQGTAEAGERAGHVLEVGNVDATNILESEIAVHSF